MRLLRVWVLLQLAVIAHWACGQSPSFHQEWRFATYLADKEAIDEAQFVLTSLDTTHLTGPQRDSLAYLTGWLAYGTKALDEAAYHLLKVSPASPFYAKAQYFGAYCLVFQKQYARAQAIMPHLPAPDSSLFELKALQRAGLALLQRQYSRYDTLSRQFRYTSYALSDEENRFNAYRKGMVSAPRRSPVMAGLLSAVVPGLGKVYAGKVKQGIAAFLPVLTLGLLSWEGYRKDGPASLRFLGFGSLFTVFYAGNIWGSAMAVRVRREEFNRGYDNKILYDMHIPVRNMLNR